MDDVIGNIVILCVLSIIGIIAILYIRFKVKEYEEMQREEYEEKPKDDCEDSDVDYVKIYKDLGCNGVFIHYIDHCIEEQNVSDVTTAKNMIPKLTNCKNCGAPLHSNRCEFCDTEYDW